MEESMKTVLATFLCLSVTMVLASGQENAKEKTRVDVMPVVETRAMPKYPDAAKKDHLEGKVDLNVLVDTRGRVEKVEVLKTDARIFNEAAIRSAKEWTFKPALKNGKPVATWVTIPFQFKLEEGKAGEKK
jgi:TonB family protein